MRQDRALAAEFEDRLKKRLFKSNSFKKCNNKCLFTPNALHFPHHFLTILKSMYRRERSKHFFIFNPAIELQAWIE